MKPTIQTITLPTPEDVRAYNLDTARNLTREELMIALRKEADDQLESNPGYGTWAECLLRAADIRLSEDEAAWETLHGETGF